jgi:hypothetical protein
VDDTFLQRSSTEQGHALRAVMGAPRIALYPPVPRPIQGALRPAPRDLPAGLDSLRRDLAALPPDRFVAALQAALADDRAPQWRTLRHFRAAAVHGDAAEAAFMARFFDNLLDHMGEPERSDFEASILGPGPLAERRQRRGRFVSRSVPAWLHAHIARAGAPARVSVPSRG